MCSISIQDNKPFSLVDVTALLAQIEIGFVASLYAFDSQKSGVFMLVTMSPLVASEHTFYVQPAMNP